jgi:hypothetical protein
VCLGGGLILTHLPKFPNNNSKIALDLHRAGTKVAAQLLNIEAPMSEKFLMHTEQSKNDGRELHYFNYSSLLSKKNIVILLLSFLIGGTLSSILYHFSPRKFTSELFIGVEASGDPTRLTEETAVRTAFVALLRNTELARTFASKTFENFGTDEQAQKAKAQLANLFSSGVQSADPLSAGVEGFALYLSTTMADLVSSKTEPVFTNSPFALLVHPTDASSWRLYLKLDRAGVAEDFAKSLMRSMAEVIVEFNDGKREQIRTSMTMGIKDMESMAGYSSGTGSDKTTEFQERKLTLRLMLHRFEHILSEVEKSAGIRQNRQQRLDRITLAGSDTKLDIEIGAGNNSIILRELQSLEIDDLTKRLAVVLETKEIPAEKKAELEKDLIIIATSLGQIKQQMPSRLIEKQIMLKFINNLGDLGSEKFTISAPRFDLASIETQKLAGAFDKQSNLIVPIGFLGGVFLLLVSTLSMILFEARKRRIVINERQ